MNLEKLYRDLSFGELSNLSLSGNGSGTILEKDRPKVLHAINEALLRLFARFDLKVKDTVIQTYKHITFYRLLPRYAESQEDTSPEDYLYIKDLFREPFIDDVLKVMSVYDGRNNRLPLNDSAQPNSLFTPETKLLQVPDPRDNQYLSIIYRAKHPELTGDLDQEIEVPDVLHSAVRSYTAYHLYNNMGTEGAVATGSMHLNKFEVTCAEVIAQDLVNSSIVSTNTRFERGGWI